MTDGCFVLTDSPGVPGDADLRTLRIRRCRGCVRCLTEHPGRCEIDDAFTGVMDRILASERLVISMSQEHGTVPDRVRKAVERLSNILDAYTDCGGNVPLSMDSVALRSVEVVYRGEFGDRMESEIYGALRKGPVSDVTFRDVTERALREFSEPILIVGPHGRLRSRWKECGKAGADRSRGEVRGF